MRALLLMTSSQGQLRSRSPTPSIRGPGDAPFWLQGPHWEFWLETCPWSSGSHPALKNAQQVLGSAWTCDRQPSLRIPCSVLCFSSPPPRQTSQNTTLFLIVLAWYWGVSVADSPSWANLIFFLYSTSSTSFPLAGHAPCCEHTKHYCLQHCPTGKVLPSPLPAHPDPGLLEPMGGTFGNHNF